MLTNKTPKGSSRDFQDVVQSLRRNVFQGVGRRGREPRTYGLEAFPITPQQSEYQAIATDPDPPRPSRNHPGSLRRGHCSAHTRAKKGPSRVLDEGTGGRQRYPPPGECSTRQRRFLSRFPGLGSSVIPRAHGWAGNPNAARQLCTRKTTSDPSHAQPLRTVEIRLTLDARPEGTNQSIALASSQESVPLMQGCLYINHADARVTKPRSGPPKAARPGFRSLF